jgi:hypothetical protein
MPAKPEGRKISSGEYATAMTNSANSKSTPRKTAWNTYYPWALALYLIVSVSLLILIVVSWLPAPELSGVPASPPLIPGLLGLFFFFMAGRQIYLRGESQR